jgi:hypothetical protein
MGDTAGTASLEVSDRAQHDILSIRTRKKSFPQGIRWLEIIRYTNQIKLNYIAPGTALFPVYILRVESGLMSNKKLSDKVQLIEDRQNSLNTCHVQPNYENDFSEYILLEPM